MATLRSLNKSCHACRRNNGNHRLVAGSCTSAFPFLHVYIAYGGVRSTCSPHTRTRAPGGRVSGSLVLSAAKRRGFCNWLPAVCVPRIRERDTRFEYVNSQCTPSKDNPPRKYFLDCMLLDPCEFLQKDFASSWVVTTSNESYSSELQDSSIVSKFRLEGGKFATGSDGNNVFASNGYGIL